MCWVRLSAARVNPTRSSALGMFLQPACSQTWKCLGGSNIMQEYFYQLADSLTPLLQSGEVYTCTFDAEDSDFVRFNRSAVRQAGTVAQRFLSLTLINGMRHTSGTVSLSGELEMDQPRVITLLSELREQLPYLP